MGLEPTTHRSEVERATNRAPLVEKVESMKTTLTDVVSKADENAEAIKDLRQSSQVAIEGINQKIDTYLNDNKVLRTDSDINEIKSE